MIRQSLTSNPPLVVCAGFFLTKFGNYCTLLILDNATVNSRHQDPLPLGCHWALHSITAPLAENCASRSFSWAQGQAHAQNDYKTLELVLKKVWADLIAQSRIHTGLLRFWNPVEFSDNCSNPFKNFRWRF